MRTQPAGKKFRTLLLVACTFILVCSAEPKDRSRVFSGQILYASTKHGVAGAVIRLQPMYGSVDQKDAASGDTAGPPSNGSCPAPDICESTERNGKFSFHQIKTGIYDLAIYKDGQVIYEKPEPVIIPEMPVNTSLVISIPPQSQN
jgi:hypothetical protein